MLLHVGPVDVCATCWWKISNLCLSCLRDLPTLVVVPAFILTKINKKKQARALPAVTLGSLNFIIIIIMIIIFSF